MRETQKCSVKNKICGGTVKQHLYGVAMSLMNTPFDEWMVDGWMGGFKVRQKSELLIRPLYPYKTTCQHFGVYGIQLCSVLCNNWESLCRN